MSYVILYIAQDGTHSVIGDELGVPFPNRYEAHAGLLALPVGEDVSVVQIERLVD